MHQLPSIFTLAVHAGERQPKPDFQPLSTPIHPAVAYEYDSAAVQETVLGQQRQGYVYRRYGNPTVQAFEAAVAALEGGEAAYATASGMAAVHAALLATGIRQGDHIVAAQDCYGATYTLIEQLLGRLGVQSHFADFRNLQALDNLVQAVQPRLLICETISNPLLRLVDVAAVAEIAHRVDASFIVDSTFTTPYLMQPLTMGADFVVHSATKYLGGHDDILAGVVICNAAKRIELFALEKQLGANLSPFDAWLGLRGLKTLPLRMQQHCRNALSVATWLSEQPQVSRVHYPGLSQHPQFSLGQTLFGEHGFGGMLSFELTDADQTTVFQFFDRLRLIRPATTLGDVYSLITHPATSSHRALTPTQRQNLGLGDNLVRLSVGIEAADDIITDLARALSPRT